MNKMWFAAFTVAVVYLQFFNFYLLKRVSDLEELVLLMQANAAERTEVMQVTSDVLDDMVEVMQRVVYVMRSQYGIEDVDD